MYRETRRGQNNSINKVAVNTSAVTEAKGIASFRIFAASKVESYNVNQLYCGTVCTVIIFSLYYFQKCASSERSSLRYDAYFSDFGARLLKKRVLFPTPQIIT